MATFGQSNTTGAGSASPLGGYLYFSGGQVSEAGTLESVTVYLGASGGAANAYVGIYKSSTDDPSGATLIADTGNLTGNYGTAGFETFSLVNGTKTFAANDWLWLGILSVNSEANFDQYFAADYGDWSQPTGLQLYNYRTTGSLSALPDPIGAVTGYTGSCLVAYVTYSAGAGATVTPSVGTLRYVGQTPSIEVSSGGGVTVTPTVGTYQFVGQAPTVGFTHSVAPSVGTLVFAGQQPSVGSTQAAAPSVGTVRFDGLQPTVSYTTNAWASPTAGTYRFDGQQPSATVSEAGAASPLVGTLRFVGDAPSVTYTDNVWVTPSVGTLRFVGQQLPLFDTSALIDFDTPAKNLLTGADQQKFRVLVRKNGTTAPTVDIDLYESGSWVADLVTGTSVTSDTGQIVSATWNASLLADISGAGVQCFVYGHSSANAQVEIGAVEWQAELEAVQTPTVGTLRFAGAAPTVAYTDHVTVTPSVGTLLFAGQQPSVTSSAAQSVAPSVGTVLVVGQQPTVSYTDHQSVAPTVGTVRFDGQQPSSAVTDHVWITPTAGEVRFGGYAPVLSATAHQWTVPSSGELRFVGQQPTLIEGGDKTTAPQSGVIRFVGNAPIASLPRERVGGDDLPPGWSKRRARLKLNRELEYTEQIREIYRQLTGSPQAAEAEAILAPVVPPVAATGESEAARDAAIEARAEALRVRADRLDYDAVQAEIALRLLYQQWRQQMEDDDVAAMELLLSHVL